MDYKFILELGGVLIMIMLMVAILYMIVARQNNKSRFWCYNFDLPHYRRYFSSRKMKS